MEEKKNGNISTLLGLIIICILVGIITFLITNMALNKLDNNSSNNNTTDNNVINENNNNNVVTADHITNDKVQAIYDQVKMEKFSVASYPRYEESNFINNMYNKIVIALSSDNINFSSLSNDQLKHIESISFDKDTYDGHTTYYTNFGRYVLTKGYIPFNSLKNQMKSLFNIEIDKDILDKVDYNIYDKNRFAFGFDNINIYDDYLDGFVKVVGNGGGDMGRYVSKVYSYTENTSNVYIDTLYAYLLPCENRDSDFIECAYKNYASWENRAKNNESAIYKDLSENSFELKLEDKDKFMTLRYTFTKRDDGSYYFSNVEEIK